MKMDYFKAANTLYLSGLPTGSKQAHKILEALAYFDKTRNPNYERDQFIIPNYSKRRERLVKMYWAFKKKEAKRA